jgi:hypothetical protein
MPANQVSVVLAYSELLSVLPFYDVTSMPVSIPSRIEH